MTHKTTRTSGTADVERLILVSKSLSTGIYVEITKVTNLYKLYYATTCQYNRNVILCKPEKNYKEISIVEIHQFSRYEYSCDSLYMSERIINTIQAEKIVEILKCEILNDTPVR